MLTVGYLVATYLIGLWVFFPPDTTASLTYLILSPLSVPYLFGRLLWQLIMNGN